MATTPRVRMDRDSRRELLLDHGVRLLATHAVEELSIEMLADEAGVSRGLLYHYFSNKKDFHQAVVRRAADDLIAQTAPQSAGEPTELLARSLEAYVDYVRANHQGYLSLVRGSAGGNEVLREIYEEARMSMTSRIFELSTKEELASLGITDSPGVRLMAHGWTALVEDVVLEWVRDPRGIEKPRLIDSLTASLLGVTQGVR